MMEESIEFNTPEELLAEIIRLKRIYNDMVRPRCVDKKLLEDGDIVEVINNSTSDLRSCNIG
ncbi:hypothetical protein LCGC14_1528490, partial [marine sediment metagenome]